MADHVLEDVGTALGTQRLTQVSQANPQGAVDPEGRRVVALGQVGQGRTVRRIRGEEQHLLGLAAGDAEG
eukprot:14657369-Alexandrium_andersonii.AAC.1